MMRKLWIARIILAALLLVCLVLVLIPGISTPSPVAGIARLQLSALYLSESIGVIVVWLLISLVWGRIYCSTMCPVGTLMDIMLHIRRRIPALNRPFKNRKPSRIRHHIFIIYAACVAVGVGAVPLILEPWYISHNIAQLLGAPGAAAAWTACGISALWGLICGAASLLVILPWALLRGREFCNTICPFGTLMGYLSARSAFQIVIDGDRCTNCMKCEEICRASAIKVVSRYVDNSSCVRCMECVAKCPDKAIAYTQQRRRPASPLFMRSHSKAGV